MRKRAGVERAGGGIRGQRRRHGSFDDVDFAFGNIRERVLRHPESSLQALGGSMGKPVGNAESAELGEISVVEYENERTISRTEPLDRVAVPARKIPYVAAAEIGGFGTVLRIDDGDAAASVEDIPPFGRIGVPVQFA